MTTPFPVHLFEEHSSTLPAWWDTTGAPRTVVYLDAHLDLQQVGDGRLRALERCRTLDEIQALEAPHHLDSSPDYAFGIENFLHPAHRLGLLDRLIWVAPPHVPRRYSQALLDYAQQMDGVSFEELAGFEPVGDSALRGRLLGLDITICDAGGLAGVGVPADYRLDIDIDYFVKVPGDALWCEPGAVVDDMLAALGPPRAATVSRAVSSAFTPLHLRFLGDHVEALLREDEAAVGHYHGLCEAVSRLERGDRKGAGRLCRAALQARPDCAAAQFLLAAAGTDADGQRAQRARAAEIDPAYGFDLCREACSFPNRRRRIDGRTLQALAAALADTGRAGGEDPFARIAVAGLHARAGRPREALALLHAGRRSTAENSGVLLTVGAALLAAGDRREAAPLLTRAGELDDTRTSAALHLGDLAFAGGDATEAQRFYEEAAGRAPAWLLPLERLQQCHETRGNRKRARQIGALLAQRRRILAELVDD